jgi:hypothetical protein
MYITGGDLICILLEKELSSHDEASAAVVCDETGDPDRRRR